MPDLNPASITVNNKNIPGFNPAATGYSYLLKNIASGAPVVKVTPADPTIKVEIIQADSVPGTAVIILTDDITVEKKYYSINFGRKSINDEFNTGTLGRQWNWVRQNPAHWSLSKKAGLLVITSEKGDLQAAHNNAENILLQGANTDWNIESKLVFSKKPAGFSQNGGLLIYQDDDNYLKLVYSGGGSRRGFGPGGQGSMLLVIEENGYQINKASLSLAGIIMEDNTLILKLSRKGNLYTASCSSDGKNFKTIGTAEIMLKNVKAGMITCNGVQTVGGFGNIPGMPGMQQRQAGQPETPFEVGYDYFHITNTGN